MEWNHHGMQLKRIVYGHVGPNVHNIYRRMYKRPCVHLILIYY